MLQKFVADFVESGSILRQNSMNLGMTHFRKNDKYDRGGDEVAALQCECYLLDLAEFAPEHLNSVQEKWFNAKKRKGINLQAHAPNDLRSVTSAVGIIVNTQLTDCVAKKLQTRGQKLDKSMNHGNNATLMSRMIELNAVLQLRERTDKCTDN